MAFIWSYKKRIIDITGRYKSDEYSRIEQILKSLYYDGFAVGCELNLRKDSTFVYKTCSMISNGIWTIEKDALILKEQEIRWSNDSLNKFGYQGKHPKIKEKLVFKFIKNKLESTIIYKSPEGKIDKTYLRIVKVN